MEKILQSQWFPTVVTLGILLLVWHFGVLWFKVPPYLIPSLGSVLEVFTSHGSLLAKETLVTTKELVGGFLLAVLTSVPLALLMAYSRVAERIVSPLVVITQAIPKVALAPLLLVWFGFGMFPKVLMAAVIAFFPMLVSTVVGFKAIEPDVLALSRSMGASAFKVFWMIRLPSALPSIFGGLKLAITFATIGAILGEFIAGDRGLGYLIQSASGSQRTDVLFAGVIVISLLSVILYYLVEMAERRFIFWHQSQALPVS
ncbi:MAG: ABC transporter permease [Burkholderiales bacterium]|nr:MAG: ABC transporter permease [Burkholderiales bacterium]